MPPRWRWRNATPCSMKARNAIARCSSSIDEGFWPRRNFGFDENQRAADYRFLEVNPAFENKPG